MAILTFAGPGDGGSVMKLKIGLGLAFVLASKCAPLARCQPPATLPSAAPATTPAAPGVVPPPVAPPAVAGPVAPPTRNIWTFLCMTQAQKDAKKEKFCRSTFGQLINNSMRPASALTGGVIPGCCPP